MIIERLGVPGKAAAAAAEAGAALAQNSSSEVTLTGRPRSAACAPNRRPMDRPAEAFRPGRDRTRPTDPGALDVAEQASRPFPQPRKDGHRTFIEPHGAKNSGKRPGGAYLARAMSTDSDASAALAGLPHGDGSASRRLVGGVATLIVEASGLDAAARSRLERELDEAVAAVPGVAQVRIALTASQPQRT